MDYTLVKTLHILSATVLFGTGLGIAFFMVRSHFTDDIQQKLYAARNTVLADMVFTLPAVILQPVTGAWLVVNGGYDWNAPWLMATYGLYILAGACWLPVVWIQIRLKRMLQLAAQTGAPPPERYHTLFRLWFILGWPAFIGLVLVFYLMVAKAL
ncbi:DUF2269 family protein [Kordiimonas lipolytica]|uniref:DUF2269 family protein n=1 Tax=Kordiimonas lipolytica TaxID=1662421 RepID=A0ABV8U9L5_9PROT|nr:DUF2269 domain-containing protein [Kordiimonas lipolytica]